MIINTQKGLGVQGFVKIDGGCVVQTYRRDGEYGVYLWTNACPECSTYLGSYKEEKTVMKVLAEIKMALIHEDIEYTMPER